MAYVVICSVAFLASCLTFFSGFGLGTLLLPAFALFFAIEQAVALTAVVHFLNGVFKVVLLWRNIDREVVVKFGLLAVVGALAGALTLLWLAKMPALVAYELFGRTFEVTSPKLIIGAALLLFASAEASARFRSWSVPPRYMPVGGLLSGFFGGLAGMQGALRSAFLVKAGLTKERYVATGSAIAFLIDVTRLTVYARMVGGHWRELDVSLLALAVLSALAGATLGNRLLQKVTMAAIKRVVAGLLFLVGVGLISGIL